MQPSRLQATSYSSQTGKAFSWCHGHTILLCELQLNPLAVSTQRQVWRATGATLGQRVGAHLQNLNAHVDAAYEIPVAGRVYIFSGKGQLSSLQLRMASVGFNFSLLPGDRYFTFQQIKMQTYAGSIRDYGFPSSVKQVDAAVHISEYGKTVFFVGASYYRYSWQVCFYR